MFPRRSSFRRTSNTPHKFSPGQLANRTFGTAAERRGKNFKGLKEFYLKANARNWPCLSYMCHVRSTADPPRRGTSLQCGRIFGGVNRPVSSGYGTHKTVKTRWAEVRERVAGGVSEEQRKRRGSAQLEGSGRQVPLRGACRERLLY